MSAGDPAIYRQVPSASHTQDNIQRHFKVYDLVHEVAISSPSQLFRQDYLFDSCMWACPACLDPTNIFAQLTACTTIAGLPQHMHDFALTAYADLQWS